MKGNFSEKKKKQIQRSNLEILENFRDAKHSLYLKVGNMYDINSMDIKDFDNLYKYIERKEKINRNEPVPLRESNRRMIEARKNKEKQKNIKKVDKNGTE